MTMENATKKTNALARIFSLEEIERSQEGAIRVHSYATWFPSRSGHLFR